VYVLIDFDYFIAKFLLR